MEMKKPEMKKGTPEQKFWGFLFEKSSYKFMAGLL